MGQAAAPPPRPAKPVVAILGCEAAGDATLRDFAKAFPELLTVALSRKGAIDLVERTQLRQLLTEQELTQSGAIDSSTAARIGHLAGARLLVTARVYAAGDFTYVSAKAIDVESGRVKAVSRGDLRKNATPALMAAYVATELGTAIEALSGATPSESDEAAALIARLGDTVRGQRLPIVAIAVEETMLRVPAPDPAVRTELGYLLRKAGFRVIESDSPALAAWAKDYALGRSSAFPSDLGAVEVVIIGSGVSDSAGMIGALSSARARLRALGHRPRKQPPAGGGAGHGLRRGRLRDPGREDRPGEGGAADRARLRRRPGQDLEWEMTMPPLWRTCWSVLLAALSLGHAAEVRPLVVAVTPLEVVFIDGAPIAAAQPMAQAIEDLTAAQLSDAEAVTLVERSSIAQVPGASSSSSPSPAWSTHGHRRPHRPGC